MSAIPVTARQHRIDDIGAWLDLRRGHITASRVGALCDAHPYLTREGLAQELRGQSVKGETPAMHRGLIFEAAILEALRLAHPEWRLERAQTYHWIEQHRLGATPDFYWDDDGLVEAKTVRPQVWDRWHARPPLAYTLQLLTGLMVTGRQRGVLAVMVMGGDYEVIEFPVERHPAAEARVLAMVAEWWRAWDAGAIAAPASATELEAMLDDGSLLDWTDNQDMFIALQRRAALKALVSGAEAELKAIDYALKNAMGPASSAWLPGWELTFRSQTRREFVVPEKTFRVLRVKQLRDAADE